VVVAVTLFLWRRSTQQIDEKTATLERNISRFFWTAIIGLAVIVEAPSLWEAFHFNSIPRGGWWSSMFANELPTFYFGQLVEFSLIYVFAYASYIFLRQNMTQEERFIQYVALGNLFFYLIWGNFQCRYILGSVPLFLLLSANFIYKWGVRLSSGGNLGLRVTQGLLLAAFILYSIMKTYHINMAFSFTNKMCYF